MNWPTDADIERNRIVSADRESDRAARVGRIVIEIECDDYGDVDPEIMLTDFRETARNDTWRIRIVE